MNDVKLTVQKRKGHILIDIDDLHFSFKTDLKSLAKFSDTKRLDKKLQKLTVKGDCFLDKGLKSKYVDTRKEAVKLITNHVLGVFSFDRLYKKYQDLSKVENIVKAVNNTIFELL